MSACRVCAVNNRPASTRSVATGAHVEMDSSTAPVDVKTLMSAVAEVCLAPPVHHALTPARTTKGASPADVPRDIILCKEEPVWRHTERHATNATQVTFQTKYRCRQEVLGQLLAVINQPL